MNGQVDAECARVEIQRGREREVEEEGRDGGLFVTRGAREIALDVIYIRAR